MGNRRLFLLFATALLLACGCVHQLPPEIHLKSADSDGVIFGRIAPLQGGEQGWVEYEKPSGGKRKTGMDPNGYFVIQSPHGTLHLVGFGCRLGKSDIVAKFDKAPAFDARAAQVTYVGVIVLSPLTRDVYLTDDFVRDRPWFMARYGNRPLPVSAFANQRFYELMNRYSGEVSESHSVIADGRAVVPETHFLMGDVLPGNCIAGPGGGDLTQIPPREVVVSAFQIDATPVTRHAFGRDGREPADRVSWTEAADYCRRQGGRLPTEAEWELAARGPRWGARYYAGAPPLTAGKPIGGDPFPVDDAAQWEKSSWGAMFQGSTLAEWTNDWSGAAASAETAIRDPHGPATGDEKVVRAGPYRFALRPDAGQRGVGFRCVYGGADLSASPATAAPSVPVPAAPEASKPAPAVEPKAKHPDQNKLKTAFVKKDATLFAGPSTKAAVVAQVAAGTEVTVVGWSDEFELVRTGEGDEGFIRRELLEEKKHGANP